MSKILDFINTLSYAEREKKKVQKYNEKVHRYTMMSDAELEMNYINISARYEHRKMVLLTVIGTLVISIIMDMWKYFFKMVRGLIILLYDSNGDTEAIARLSLIVTLIIAVTVFVIILLVVLDLFKGMKTAITEKLFIDNYMKKRNNREQQNDD